MRRWGGMVMTLIIIALVAGCAKAPQEGYVVMFEGSIRLYDNGVYFNGTNVGEVLTTEKGSGYVTRLMVHFNPEFINKIGQNVALYVDGGRLAVDKLQGIGGRSEEKTPLCGFGSEAAFNWFKFKTLLKDRIPAATQRALALQARMDQ